MSWRERLMSNVKATATRTAREGPRGHPWIGMLLRVHPDIHRTLHIIAKQRGVSTTTYVRRLLVMAIVKETQTGLAGWLHRMPAPAAPDNLHIASLKDGITYDNGAGMEGMCTHPGCREVHW